MSLSEARGEEVGRDRPSLAGVFLSLCCLAVVGLAVYSGWRAWHGLHVGAMDLSHRLDELGRRLDDIDQRLAGLGQRLDDLSITASSQSPAELRVAKIERRLEDALASADSQRQSLAKISTDIESTRKGIADLGVFLTELRSQISGMEGRISQVEADLKSVKGSRR
jgi:chromosome segregation ATPase